MIITKTYSPNESPIVVVSADGTTTIRNLLIRVGNNDCTGAISLLILDNNKCYLSKGIGSTVYHYEEIDPITINKMSVELTSLKTQIGELSNLLTGKNNSIVDAINNMVSASTSPRHLAGQVEWLVNSLDSLTKIDIRDKDIFYDKSTKTWYYYSSALNEGVKLPDNWLSLNIIVRSKEEMEALTPSSKILCGVLEEGKVYRVFDTHYEEITIDPGVEPGTEYLVSYIETDTDLIKSGSIIYTQIGWVYLMNNY